MPNATRLPSMLYGLCWAILVLLPLRLSLPPSQAHSARPRWWRPSPASCRLTGFFRGRSPAQASSAFCHGWW
jgi:hypothetical protein